MRSIRRRLFLSLAGGLLALFPLCGAGFYLYVRYALVRQFDDDLTSQLRGFVATTELEDLAEHTWYLDRNSTAAPGGSASFVEIRTGTGAVVARSPSLGQTDLPYLSPRGAQPVHRDVQLPQGRHGRMAVLRFVPRVEDEDEGELESAYLVDPSQAAGQPFYAAMARSREGLDAALRAILLALLAMAVALPAAAILLVGWITRRELRTLERVAQTAEEIGPQELSRRLPVDEVPVEILPLCERMNELLERIEAAFQRERRFTAAAAHELRTPVSELRVLAEVALQGQEESHAWENVRPYFTDALEIALQMERLVSALLALSRCEAGTQVAEPKTVDVAALVRQIWASNAAACQAKNCTASAELPEHAFVESDPVLLAGVLNNLLSNAVQHVPKNGEIAMRLTPIDGRVVFEVANTYDTLEPSDLEHMFQAFWRKDAARSSSSHAGLGLALAASYARVLQGSLNATLQRPDTVLFRLELPAVAGNASSLVGEPCRAPSDSSAVID